MPPFLRIGSRSVSILRLSTSAQPLPWLHGDSRWPSWYSASLSDEEVLEVSDPIGEVLCVGSWHTRSSLVTRDMLRQVGDWEHGRQRCALRIQNEGARVVWPTTTASGGKYGKLGMMK